LILEDPQSGQPPPLDYTRSDGDSSVILVFPHPGTAVAEAVNLDLWVDMSQLKTAPDSSMLITSMWLQENSVFKMVKLEAYSAMQMELP
jgi:hypothetical protein